MSGRHPFDATLVLPRALKLLAEQHAAGIWAAVPKNSRLTEPWHNITYGELGQAVNGFASWALPLISDSDVVAYVGINDVRYTVAEIGIIKMGRTVFLPSPRNSNQDSASLFAACACSIVIHSEAMDSHIAALRSVLPALRTHMIPSFDHLHALGTASKYTDQCRVEEDAPAIILQTSGSTGAPRPITLTNGSVATFKHISDLSLPPGFKNQDGAVQALGKPMFSMAPFFHESGTVLIIRSILCRGPVILPPPGQPPTADLVLRMLQETKPSIAVIFPSILEDLVQLPGGLETLAPVDMVTFGGAPLAQEVGNMVSRVTFLYSGIGSTEAGVLATQIPRDRQDWNYHAWSPASGVEMRLTDDGLWECVIKLVDRRYQRIFHTYPGITEYRTKDLFEQHPTKPGLWKFRGRADDIIVLSNGEKLNPVDFEKRLEAHLWVRGAVVVGQDRLQTGLLIEPAWELLPGDCDILEQLWPTIEQGNQILPKHGAVWKSKVALTTKEKPLVRTSTKGNVIRGKSLALYAAEISAMYGRETKDHIERLPPDFSSNMLETHMREFLQTPGMPSAWEMSADQDLFALGMDSLQALHLATMLSHILARPVTAAEIYKHPTIADLVDHLGKNRDLGVFEESSRVRAMTEMVEKYTRDMSKRTGAAIDKGPTTDHCVLLTGSTGNLGCLLLQELINSPGVSRIYCVNRAEDGHMRQNQQFMHRGLDSDFSKVVFFHSKGLSEHRLGLSSECYEELLRSVSLIVLNAWTVDFNMALQSYEGLVKSTRKFVDFSIQSRHFAHISFISSVASVGNWASINKHHQDSPEVPERIIHDHRVAAPSGYGESKHVASLILATAGEVGVSSTIIRVGQLAGPAETHSQMEWNQREWVPNLIATSKALALLPESLGGLDSIDWVPVNLAARAIIELSQARPETAGYPVVQHVVNPRTTDWTELVSSVRDVLAEELGRDIPIVAYATWLSKLKEVANTTTSAKSVPGLKLLDFYEGLATLQGSLRLATTDTVKTSPTMAGLSSVSAKLMNRWTRRMGGTS